MILVFAALLAQGPDEWPGLEASAAICRNDRCRLEQSEAREQLIAGWDYAQDERHRTLIRMSIENHTSEAGTDWAGAHRDYLNRAAAVRMEDRVMRQIRAQEVNREIRREQGSPTITTTCRTTGSRFYPNSTTTCTTQEE